MTKDEIQIAAKSAELFLEKCLDIDTTLEEEKAIKRTIRFLKEF